jgi:uncharacterized protein YwgA
MSDILKIGLLLRDGGPIVGHNKFQEIIHVLQESGVDFEARYELSHFGPYSSELKGSIDELVAARLIEVETDGAERPRYSVTHTFVTLLNRAASEAPAAWSIMAQELNAQEAGDVEGISTVLFLASRGWRDSDLDMRFKAIKPHLGDRASQFLRSGMEITAKRTTASA